MAKRHEPREEDRIPSIAARVTAIIPAYQSAGVLEAALESLLAQTERRWEAIVVNDGSTDGTSRVAHRWAALDPRIRVIEQENRGLGAARNAALNGARAPFLHCLDADDVIDPEFYATMLRALETPPGQHSAGRCAVSSLRAFGATCAPGAAVPPPPAEAWTFESLVHRNLQPPVCFVFERTILERTGGFDETARHCHDWDLWLRFARVGVEFRSVPEAMSGYRIGEASLSTRALPYLDAGAAALERTLGPDPRCAAPESLPCADPAWVTDGLAHFWFLNLLRAVNRDSNEDLDALFVWARRRLPARFFRDPGAFGVVPAFAWSGDRPRPAEGAALAWVRRGTRFLAALERWPELPAELLHGARRSLLHELCHLSAQEPSLDPADLGTVLSRGLSWLGASPRPARTALRLLIALLLPGVARRLLPEAQPLGVREGSGRRRRVLFVTNANCYGGSEKHLDDWICHLDPKGVTPIILCLGEDVYSGSPNRAGAAPTRVVSKRNPITALGYARAFRAEEPDVIVFVNGHLGVFPGGAYLAARFVAGTRVFGIEHIIAEPIPPMAPESAGGLVATLRTHFGWHARELRSHRSQWRVCRETLCVSDAVRDRLIGSYGFPEERTRTVRNGVDLERFSRNLEFRATRTHRASRETPECIVVSLARLVRQKRIDVLLEALAALPPEVPQWECWIVGEGPLRPELVDLARHLGLESRVRFLGHHDDVRGLLAQADLFVLSSQREGLPLSILESMALGVACVATDVGGCREAVAHGETGLIVPPHDPGALADAVAQLLIHKDERERMAACGLARVREHFDLRHSMSRLTQRILGEG